jgi:hypothetical protein
MIEKEMGSIKEHYSKRLSVEEFLVDLLGGLVPGVLFIVAITLSLFPSIHVIVMTLRGKDLVGIGEIISHTFVAIQNTPSAIWITLFLGGILFSYVVGHLFYRYDPKKADKSSFQKVSKSKDNFKDEDKRSNLGCADLDDCEFPYPYYHLYLKQRGLEHLLPFILWQEEEKKNFRSKIYVNLLKIRLRHYYPEKCGAIIRNEAHVRLASSTWYVAKILMIVSIICFCGSISAFFWSFKSNLFNDWQQALSWYIPAIFAPSIVFMFSVFAWRTIRGFLHYQRMREVFFVLETAHTAFKDNLSLLDPPFSEDLFSCGEENQRHNQYNKKVQ